MMKMDYPATGRNKEPILSVLRELVKPGESVLEVASGSGQHAEFFASQLGVLLWQPSDISDEALDSIDAYCSDISCVSPAVKLDVLSEAWKVGQFHHIYCANMIHISPKESCMALFQRGRHHLEEGGKIILYGPFIEPNVLTTESNINFDLSLRDRDPRFGIRNIIWVDDVAADHSFKRVSRHEMPSHNLILVYKKNSR